MKIIPIRDGISIEKVLKILQENNISEENYKNVKIDIDYSTCYYAGDYPDLNLEIDI